jgi:hypothetical protein
MDQHTRPEAPLTSWKEIGAYIGRNDATARRWEKEEGLPVHRQTHKRRASVYGLLQRNRRLVGIPQDHARAAAPLENPPDRTGGPECSGRRWRSSWS